MPVRFLLVIGLSPCLAICLVLMLDSLPLRLWIPFPYFAHPDSKYFAVGKLDRDQVAELAARKGATVAEMERWLGPWLNYDSAAK